MGKKSDKNANGPVEEAALRPDSIYSSVTTLRAKSVSGNAAKKGDGGDADDGSPPTTRSSLNGWNGSAF